MKKFLAYLIPLLFLLTPFVASANLTTGLVGYWKFDEGSGTTAADATGNGNTGTLVNSPSWVTGIINDALTFNYASNQKVSTTYRGPLGTSAWSISLWFKTTDTRGASTNTLFTWGDNNGGGNGVSLDVENGVIWDRSYYGNTNHWGSGYNTGTWHYLVVTAPGGTYTTTNILCYVDGTLLSGSPAGSVALNITNSLGNNVIIGDQSIFGYFNGTIDEVGVWSRALTSTEVSELYNSGAGCQYPFGACTPSTARPSMLKIWGGFFRQRGGQLIIR